MKKIRVLRYVLPEFANQYPEQERMDECEYTLEEACSQGFLASMCDGEHAISCKLVEV